MRMLEARHLRSRFALRVSEASFVKRLSREAKFDPDCAWYMVRS